MTERIELYRQPARQLIIKTIQYTGPKSAQELINLLDRSNVPHSRRLAKEIISQLQDEGIARVNTKLLLEYVGEQ